MTRLLNGLNSSTDAVILGAIVVDSAHKLTYTASLKSFPFAACRTSCQVRGEYFFGSMKSFSPEAWEDSLTKLVKLLSGSLKGFSSEA